MHGFNPADESDTRAVRIHLFFRLQSLDDEANRYVWFNSQKCLSYPPWFHVSCGWGKDHVCPSRTVSMKLRVKKNSLCRSSISLFVFIFFKVDYFLNLHAGARWSISYPEHPQTEISLVVKIKIWLVDNSWPMSSTNTTYCCRLAPLRTAGVLYHRHKVSMLFVFGGEDGVGVTSSSCSSQWTCCVPPICVICFSWGPFIAS